MARVKKTSDNMIMSKKELIDAMPLCFKESVDVVSAVSKDHPEMSGDLKKALVKFITEVDKVSTKHGVLLGSEVYFTLLTGGVENGK